MKSLRVVTFNLLNKPSRWQERRTLIAAEMAQLQPDLIALQEVQLPDNSAEWLAMQLGNYSVHLATKTGALQDKEGIAILSRLPLEQAGMLDLRSQQRVAQFVRVRVSDRSLILVNGHFFFHIVDHIQRVRQVQHLLGWLGHTKQELPTIVCGDFNDTPGSRSIRLMCQHFSSAHSLAHGREPEYTVPTALHYPLSSVRKTLSRIGNVALNRSIEPWRGTVDYIFINRHLHVLECRPVLNRPAPHDQTLYPSDHIGLVATLSL